MKLRKPYRIKITSIESINCDRHGCAGIVTMTLKAFNDSYEVNLNISNIKQLHLSYYIAGNTLNIVSQKKYMAAPDGRARLLFRLLLPLDILSERIIVKRQDFGICISLYRKKIITRR